MASRLTILKADAARVGLYVATHSPGGCGTRYKFDYENRDYFAMRGVFTALGISDAETFLSGYVQAFARIENTLGTSMREMLAANIQNTV